MPDVEAILAALDKQRTAERDFVERARDTEKAPQGWPAALILFHVGMWRERMRNALTEIAEGREQTTVPPPRDQLDAVNDAEIATGIGTPLADAAARADHLLSEIAGLYARVGDRPLIWNESKTTTTGVLRSCYTHPRLHMSSYYDENGDGERALALFEEAVADMRAAGAPDLVMAIVLYKLASMRVREKRDDDAITLLREAIERRPDTTTTAASDPDFERLRDVEAFRELTKA